MERLLDISSVKRIVVKIGSNTITNNGTGLDKALIHDSAWQIAELRKKYNIQTVVFSSGAVKSGYLLDNSLNKEDVVDAQAAAIFGQPTLISTWVDAFAKNGEKAGQVLYKDDDLEGAHRPLLRALEIGTVIGNGNDAVFDREIKALMQKKASDNDLLSTYVARAINADLFISLTSAPGVIDSYDRVIRLIGSDEEVAVKQMEKTAEGTGGIDPKVRSLQDFTRQTGGIGVIADGRIPNIIWDLAHGVRLGTWFIK